MLRDLYRAKSNEAAWVLVGLGAAAVAGVAARNLIKAGWLATYDEHPPLNPASPDTGWMQAIAFTGLMGAGVGIARLLGRRTAAEGWRRITGKYPEKLRRHTSVFPDR